MGSIGQLDLINTPPNKEVPENVALRHTGSEIEAQQGMLEDRRGLSPQYSQSQSDQS